MQTISEMSDQELDAEIERISTRVGKMRRLLNLRSEAAIMDESGEVSTDDQKVVDAALKEVAFSLKVTTEEIFGRSREDYIVKARHTVCYIARENGLSFCAIGRLIGRDHGSIMSACRSLKNRMDTDIKFAAKVQDIQNAVKIILTP